MSTCREVDASLLAQKIDGRLATTDSLRTAARVRLAAIPSANEELWDLGTFAFVASHLFSAGGRHLSDIAELLCRTKRTEELHTEVQVIISSPNLSMTLIYDFSWRWNLYLNMCVATSVSEDLEAPGANAPFLIDSILFEIEGGIYVGPLLPGPMTDLLVGWRLYGGGRKYGADIGGSGGGSGNDDKIEAASATASRG